MTSNALPLRLGIVFRRDYPQSALPAFARQAEAGGFDELWLVEDCFYGGGIALATTALASTQTIFVGLGIMPAVARNPVFSAMDIATLADLYPGRFLPGLGHGMPHWMRQIGAMPPSQMTALEESTVVIRRLLHGEQVSYEGQHVVLDQAKLVHVPQQAPPISLGVRGPKSLQLSGRVADGTLLAEYSAPAYIQAARDQIDQGMATNSRPGPHRLTVMAIVCPADQIDAARELVRPLIAAAIAKGSILSQLALPGMRADAQALLDAGGGRQPRASNAGCLGRCADPHWPGRIYARKYSTAGCRGRR